MRTREEQIAELAKRFAWPSGRLEDGHTQDATGVILEAERRAEQRVCGNDGGTKLSSFEKSTLANLRSQSFVLTDAINLVTLLRMVACVVITDEAQTIEQNALRWLGDLLQERLDLLAALTGTGAAPTRMKKEWDA